MLLRIILVVAAIAPTQAGQRLEACDESTILASDELLLLRPQAAHLNCGVYTPSDCDSHESFAIIVPYRDRPAQVRIFIAYMNDFLMRQRRSYGIFIIEQAGNEMFNRGMLLNVGVRMASAVGNWTCYFLHDVDLLPLNISLRYKCPLSREVEHWSSAIDKYNYSIPYRYYFGGVTSIRHDDFVALNGYPNSFWGWGGEDDCFYRRCRGKLLFNWLQRWATDGLNATSFRIRHFVAYKSHFFASVYLRRTYDTTPCTEQQTKTNTLDNEFFDASEVSAETGNEELSARIKYSCQQSNSFPMNGYFRVTKSTSDFHNAEADDLERFIKVFLIFCAAVLLFELRKRRYARKTIGFCKLV